MEARGLSVSNVLRMARLPTSNEEVVYLGGSAGHLGHFSRTSYADFGSAYPVSFRTKDDDFGFPSIEKGVGNAFVMANGSGDYLPTHTYMLDDAFNHRGDLDSGDDPRRGSSLATRQPATRSEQTRRMERSAAATT